MDIKQNKTIVQEEEGEVEQAVPGTSKESSPGEVGVPVEHLDPITSGSYDRDVKKRRDALSKMEEGIRELAGFVKDKNNVHKAIKDLVRSILRSLETAQPTVPEGVCGRAMGTQTSSSQNSRPAKKQQRMKSPSNNKGERKTTHVLSHVSAETGGTQVEAPITPPAQVNDEGVWKTVERRKKRERPKMRPPRPDALVLKAKEGKSYADILRTLKGDPELQDLGSNVTKIRRGATGSLVLVLDRKSSGKAEEWRTLAAEKLSGLTEVARKTEEEAIELRDLDELTNASDILQALKKHLGEETQVSETAVKSLRKAYGGTQTAVVVLPVDQSRKLLTGGKLRVGWVVSRVRVRTSPVRCYRCMSFGHVARDCRGPDRSKACFRCGGEGHTGKTCSADPKCLLCSSDNGHSTGSAICPAYQRAVRETAKRSVYRKASEASERKQQ